MRKLTLALAIGVLATFSAIVVPQPAKAASTHHVKVVIVVGQTQSATAGYIAQAETIAQQFRDASTAGRPIDVTTFYSPHAWWKDVAPGAKGANVLVYLGHGNGYPNPYVSYLQPFSDNGMGLDGGTAGKTYYYGEAQVAQLNLAPNAIVILNHLCYASGNSEGGRAKLDHLTEAIAKTRVEGYASGFLRGGAGAVIAEGLNDISYYVNSLVGSSMSVDDMWTNFPWAHDHFKSWTSSRNPTATAHIDPDLDNPRSDGDVYYRSLVAKPGLTTSQVLNGEPATFTPQSGSYYKMTPTRVVDTRGYGIGPSGKLASNGSVNYQIAGLGGVPTNAVAITANVTVTGAKGAGWMYVAPTITATPASSTLNFPAYDDRANGITVGLSSIGTIAVWYASGSNQVTEFIIDVTGYFLPDTAGAGYVAFDPTRFLDTRHNTGLSGRFVNGHHRTIDIAGVSGMPSTGVVAIAGNITVVNPSARGYVFLGPDPTDSPTSSTINLPAHDTRANNVIVPLNADGSLSATFISMSAGATTDIVLDISGYYTNSGGTLYHSMAPARIMDSRAATRIPASFTKFFSTVKQNLPVWGQGGVATGAVAISGNLTVVNQTSAGYAAIGPTIDASTLFSNLNFPRGDTRANGVTVPLKAADGSLDVMYAGANGGRADLILDVTGYYKDPA